MALTQDQISLVGNVTAAFLAAKNCPGIGRNGSAIGKVLNNADVHTSDAGWLEATRQAQAQLLDQYGADEFCEMVRNSPSIRPLVNLDQ